MILSAESYWNVDGVPGIQLTEGEAIFAAKEAAALIVGCDVTVTVYHYKRREYIGDDKDKVKMDSPEAYLWNNFEVAKSVGPKLKLTAK